MMRILLFFIFMSISTVFTHGALASEKPDFATSFSQGLQALKESRPVDAQKAFHEATQQEPGNTAAVVNLALSYAQAQDFGRAIAYFRRALVLEPNSSEARQGLEFSQTKLIVKEIPHRIEFSETLHEQVLSRLPFNTLMAMSALFILASGWLLFRWLGDRRRARRAEEAPPSVSFRLLLLLILAVSSNLLIVAKVIDSLDRRATVVDGPVDILSAPGADGVKVSEFHPGFEIILRRTQDDWAQVTYPGGPTGWIPSRHLIEHE